MVRTMMNYWRMIDMKVTETAEIRYRKGGWRLPATEDWLPKRDWDRESC